MESPLLVENFLGETPKARQGKIQAKPATVAGRLRAATEGGSDFYRITSMESLFQAWIKARRSKSRRHRVQRFAADPLRYLFAIQKQVRSRTFEFGPYKSFKVQEKKMRDVVDAPMKDRIIHWVLYDYLLGIWMPRFIHDTYGNLPGRGTHSAIRRMASFCRKPANTWCLQLDISKYFYSVPHDFLKAESTRFIGDHDIRSLMMSLIDSYLTDGRFDHLFSAASAYRLNHKKGMPPGNLPSQLLANIVLCSFDHWVKETLRIKYYLRYVDDITILGSSPEQLREQGDRIIAKLDAIGLCIHPYKQSLRPVKTGIPYLGYVVWPNHVSAGSYMRARYHRCLRLDAKGENKSSAINSYQAMLRHTGAQL